MLTGHSSLQATSVETSVARVTIIATYIGSAAELKLSRMSCALTNGTVLLVRLCAVCESQHGAAVAGVRS